MIDWLSGLPLGALYLAIGSIAALENLFPPFPSDIVVAFGSFLAARGKASPYTTFAVSWMGNFIGALSMYWVGRRYGSSAFLSRLEKWAGKGAEQRMLALYGRYGLPALFISRFLPAVRAVVPPVAGAMKLPAIPVIFAMFMASGVWFAFITFIAYRAGSDWDHLYATILRSGKYAGFIAIGLVLIVALVVTLRKKRKAGSADTPP
jgi:membrane protein DedA with SNARE-associated domain